MAGGPHGQTQFVPNLNFFGINRVHYQLIPSEKPFASNCLGTFARLTALAWIMKP